MKLLGWMHRKFRHGTGDPSKDSITGNSCCCISGRPTPVADDKNSDARKRTSFGTYPFDDYYAVPPPPRPSSDLINGLLAIGTLGVGLTHIAADEDIRFSGVGADAQTFEIDLKLINVELEKVLFADDVKGGGGGGGGEGEEKSVTEAATVTAAAVDVESDGGGSVTVCPLQGYLFGSPIEMAETSPAKKESHHHQRTSLGELFMRAKEEEPTTRRVDEAEDNKREAAEKSTAVMQLVKKIMRRRSSIKGGCGGGASAAGMENKMQKILHIFHRKVHPERPTMPLKKSSKQWKDPQTVRKPSMANRTAVISGKEIPRRLKGTQTRGGAGPLAIRRCDSNDGREFWIKTDADYLVLEL